MLDRLGTFETDAKTCNRYLSGEEYDGRELSEAQIKYWTKRLKENEDYIAKYTSMIEDGEDHYCIGVFSEKKGTQTAQEGYGNIFVGYAYAD